VFETSSRLAVDRERLWAEVSTMQGVNFELAPWLRMSVPAEVRGKSLTDVRLGEVAFESWLLTLGFLPFDRHRLCLVEVEPGRGFVERSSSWLERIWQHERTLEAVAGGTEIRDRITFEPRIAVLTPVVGVIVARLFRHRHARLRSRFGALEPHHCNSTSSE
jgi:ligand-binding SRPBCC domain-containing protein